MLSLSDSRLTYKKMNELKGTNAAKKNICSKLQVKREITSSENETALKIIFNFFFVNAGVLIS